MTSGLLQDHINYIIGEHNKVCVGENLKFIKTEKTGLTAANISLACDVSNYEQICEAFLFPNLLIY